MSYVSKEGGRTAPDAGQGRCHLEYCYGGGAMGEKGRGGGCCCKDPAKREAAAAGAGGIAEP